MTDQLIACYLFSCMLHSLLLSGRLDFDPQPPQILFLRKRNLICSVASIAVCTDIHEIWHDCPTVKGYTCFHNFNNSVSYNISIMRISEVEAILTIFCTWLCNFVTVMCGLTVLFPKCSCENLSVRQQFAMQLFSAHAPNRKPIASHILRSHHPSHYDRPPVFLSSWTVTAERDVT